MIDLDLMATNIKKILATVPGIKEAFDYEPQSMSQLPAATIYFDGFSQSDSSTRSNNVSWNWIVRLYVPLKTSDIKAPQVEIRTLIQNTIDQFRKDPSLGNVCLFHTIGNGDVFTVLDQNNPLMMAELTLSATTQEYY